MYSITDILFGPKLPSVAVLPLAPAPTLDALHFPSSSVSGPAAQTPNDLKPKYHIYFIPGNPGLISYYTTFLSELYSILNRTPKKPSSSTSRSHASADSVLAKVEVWGRSLDGFEIGGTVEKQRPRGLNDQIDHIDMTLADLVGPSISRWIRRLVDADLFQVLNLQSARPPISPEDRIIIIGHSVGAYILLEILRRCNEGTILLKRQNGDWSSRVIGGVCLFPTIVDIAKSKSGKRLGWLLGVSYVTVILGLIVPVLTSLIPFSLLVRVVAVFTRFPDDKARITAMFLNSKGGVEQALHMARDEMTQIKSDRWDDGIWGSADSRATESGQYPPQLFFYFGNEDHWVADHTRDTLIAERAYSGKLGEEWKTRMEIGTVHIPHGFCIRHNIPMATKVADYIEEIINFDQQRSYD